MPVCEHSDICGRNALDGHDGKCILHSKNPEKDEEAFEEALEEHREEHGPNFARMVFPARASFSEATFEGEADFAHATFGNQVQFVGESGRNRLFANNEVIFTGVTYDPNTPPKFRFVDLSRCRLARTDLRKINFAGVRWCEEVSEEEWFRRVGVYDEIVLKTGEDAFPKVAPWAEIERLYRQLKKSYEGQGGFPRAGDFHIGEKEARRRNPKTHWSMRLLLNSYRGLSKYGERTLPSAFWLVGLVLGCAVGYLSMGGETESVWLTSWSLHDWWEALVLSGEATLFPVRSAGFHNIGPRALNLVQRGLSPILIALLALALRQRVKR